MLAKRVAVILPTIALGGGTENVAAWTLEALNEKYQVTLVTFSQVDIPALNQFYGTDLRQEQFTIIGPRLPSSLLRSKRFSILKDRVMMRYCKSRDSQFDLFLFLGEGMEFGSHGMQYMAFKPGMDFDKLISRAGDGLSWRVLPKQGYMRVCDMVSPLSQETMRQNVTLVASDWTGKAAKKIYGIDDYQVVYPPVIAPPTPTAWEKRQDGFLLIARLEPNKRVDQAISILKEVRDKGFDLSLHIIGRRDDPQYSERIKRLCEENSDWCFAHGVVSREELSSLMGRYKYGINAALGEPFGTAFAELVKAGCIVFVSNDGGHTEVVGTPELIFDGNDEAVEKITNVLCNEPLQTALLEHLTIQGEMFSTQVFCRSIQGAVHDFFESL